MDKEDNASTLAGYHALDLTDEKGMFCSRLLADMGAEVIRIEKPGETAARNRLSWVTNLGKRSITLNIETGEGQTIFKRLAETADVIVETYPFGYLKTLGLDYPALSEINPRIIMASITDFGQSGPYRDYKSSDMVASALGGQIYVSGEPDTSPLKPFGAQAYYSACLFGATGILLALQNRHGTGAGQHIDVSIHECAAATLDHVMVRYFYEGAIARRQGSLYWNNAFRVFPCHDGYVLLSLLQQWETLREWLDSEGMAEDLTESKWQEREYRLQHIDHIIEVMERWTRTHTASELVETGQLMRFPWAKVTSTPELMKSPQLEERRFWTEVEHPETGKKYRFPGAPCQLSRSPWQVGKRAPHPGEDNMSIYRGELGLSAEDMESLAGKGVI